MMKVLVTGATGFVGSYLAEALVQRGYRVRALVRSSSHIDPLQSLGVELCYGEITDTIAVEAAVKGCQQVYHLAGIASRLHASRQMFYQINVEGTQTVARAVLKYGVDRLIHGGSAGIYGWIKQTPITETTPPNPNTLYRTSKWQAEQVLWRYHHQEKLPVVVARLSSIYGPSNKNWLGFIQAVASKTFTLIGSGRNHNHLTYISDIIHGLCRCGEVSGIEGRCYLLAGAAPVQVRELAQIIADNLGVAISPRHLPIQPYWLFCTIADVLYQRFRWEISRAHTYDLFVNDRILDITKARQELGYAPQVSLAEGFNTTIAWFRANGKL